MRAWTASFGNGIMDPVALVGLVVVIATGIFYVFRQIVTRNP